MDPLSPPLCLTFVLQHFRSLQPKTKSERSLSWTTFGCCGSKNQWLDQIHPSSTISPSYYTLRNSLSLKQKQIFSDAEGRKICLFAQSERSKDKKKPVIANWKFRRLAKEVFVRLELPLIWSAKKYFCISAYRYWWPIITAIGGSSPSNVKPNERDYERDFCYYFGASNNKRI